jgi:hypothetical protein
MELITELSQQQQEILSGGGLGQNNVGESSSAHPGEADDFIQAGLSLLGGAGLGGYLSSAAKGTTGFHRNTT